MTSRYKHIKEALMCVIEEQLTRLEEIDACELGEVVDMVKDIEEAEYYHTVVKAMHESDGEDRRYYPKMYYGGGTDHYDWAAKGTGVWDSNKEKEWDHTFYDPREGKSYRARRMYMEAKEIHQDKATQMKELEKYMQELAQDIVEMVEDASPEERQYLSKKILALSNKLSANG